MRARGTETEQSLQKRLKHAKEDLDAGFIYKSIKKNFTNNNNLANADKTLFDYVIINDDLEKAYNEFMVIISPQLAKINND